MDYGIMFHGEVKTLNFSLEEVHSVRVLLLALKLDEKYLSKIAKESTECEDAAADPDLTTSLRIMAYAITRYAPYLTNKLFRN